MKALWILFIGFIFLKFQAPTAIWVGFWVIVILLLIAIADEAIKAHKAESVAKKNLS